MKSELDPAATATIPTPHLEQKPAHGRAEIAGPLVCAAVGLVLAIAPHLTMLCRHGTLHFLADGDDVLYLAISRPPYHGEHLLRDPFCGPWEVRPTLYSWLQFVPLAVLARGLGIDPLLMPLLWRVVGGPLLGLSVYFVFRQVLEGTRWPSAWALGCTLIALADVGFVGGQTLFGAKDIVRGMLQGETPLPTPNALGHFRVVTPLLSLPALLGLVGVLMPPRPGQQRGMSGLIAGIALLGLCVHLYFFFWTAAVVGMTLIVAGWCVAWLRARGRDDGGMTALRCRTELAFVTAVLIGGMAVGAPQIVSNARTFADPELKPILQRLSRGQKLPPGHLARTRFVRNVWVLGKLAVGAAVILGLGSAAGGWRLAPVWAFTAAGYLLVNSAIVTGLEFENFHWVYVHGPLGEILVLASLALVLDRVGVHLPAITRCAGWLWALPIGLTILALCWRPYEVLCCRDTVFHNRVLRTLVPLRASLARLGPSDIVAGPHETNVAVLMGRAGQLYQYEHTLCSSVIADSEVDERHALSAWLQGMTLDDYMSIAGRDKYPVGEVLEPRWQPEAVARARGAIFRGLEEGGSAGLLSRYRPNYLLRPSALGPPDPQRGGPWGRVDRAGEWALWTRSRGVETSSLPGVVGPCPGFDRERGVRRVAACNLSPVAPLAGRGAGGEGSAALSWGESPLTPHPLPASGARAIGWVLQPRRTPVPEDSSLTRSYPAFESQPNARRPSVRSMKQSGRDARYVPSMNHPGILERPRA